MRTDRLLDALMPRTRQAILGTLLLHPERGWYVRELARHLGLQPSTVQSELASLAEAGVLTRRKEGVQVYYQADPECPILPELQGLVVKTAGLVDILRELLEPLRERIRVALVFGSLARGTEVGTSDVDLLVIGEVSLRDLAPIASRAAHRLSRPVNPSCWPPEEFTARARAGDDFVRQVLDEPKLFVIGSALELGEVAQRTASRGSRRDQAGARRAAGEDRAQAVERPARKRRRAHGG